ncbi:MAG: hypothetical protein K2X44_11965, partial [Magnetospirillum sp.]|nr:hypothetical protein [Magnetospirillum sp.]
VRICWEGRGARPVRVIPKRGSAMDPGLSFLLVMGFVGAAVWSMALWWDRAPVAEPLLLVPGPGDSEPHTLTLLGPDGRPNPLHYESFPNYLAALTRQRELSRRGHDSVVSHAGSGAIRVDLAAWLGPYGRIGF